LKKWYQLSVLEGGVNHLKKGLIFAALVAVVIVVVAAFGFHAGLSDMAGIKPGG
jgi:hypothetical protein